MMNDKSGIDWDDAFANGAYIENGTSYPPIWAARAAAFRQEANRAKTDMLYGEHPREKLDLFFPSAAPHGLVVIVHGGYWLNFDKSSWSDLAEGALGNGWAVAMPSYTLAPEARIENITRQIGRAITRAAEQIAGPIRLAGHSAGGHLVTRMVCDDSPLQSALLERVEGLVSISGLHDLRPLQLTTMNEQLHLTPQSAALESAVLHRPVGRAQVVCWVGGAERPEFLRQSAVLVETWGRAGAKTQLVVDPGKHHFDVIDGLKDPQSDMTHTLLGLAP
jgi:acetyl esterase/lipase